jgi:hypothetical protein
MPPAEGPLPAVQQMRLPDSTSDADAATRVCPASQGIPRLGADPAVSPFRCRPLLALRAEEAGARVPPGGWGRTEQPRRRLAERRYVATGTGVVGLSTTSRPHRTSTRSATRRRRVRNSSESTSRLCRVSFGDLAELGSRSTLARPSVRRPGPARRKLDLAQHSWLHIYGRYCWANVRTVSPWTRIQTPDKSGSNSFSELVPAMICAS